MPSEAFLATEAQRLACGELRKAGVATVDVTAESRSALRMRSQAKPRSVWNMLPRTQSLVGKRDSPARQISATAGSAIRILRRAVNCGHLDRHHGAQARRGDVAREGRCAADRADGARPRVAPDDAGRDDDLDCPRGQPAHRRDGRERRAGCALAGGRAARRSRKRERRSTTSSPTASGRAR